jgi:hypothetical protein
LPKRIKQAGDKWQTDIESLAVKIFDHIPSAKCIEELKTIFYFFDEGYENLLFHMGRLTLITCSWKAF